MLSRGLKLIFMVGILLVVSAIVLHYVFRLYKAPTDAEFDVLGAFFATFASTILTFLSVLCSSTTRSRRPKLGDLSSSSCSWG